MKVGPSPDWLRAKLESIGLRAINNVVDVTNFVMMASGQPLHAFDAAKVRGTLRVRQAKEGEQFLALDGKTYALAPTDLMIADDEKALAIAGIMGGEDSGVTAATTDVLLEAAVFDAASIRRTSRRLGLSSDSSYRFERGVWPGGVERASLCAAKLHRRSRGSISAVSPAGEAGQSEISGAAQCGASCDPASDCTASRRCSAWRSSQERVDADPHRVRLRERPRKAGVPPGYRPDLTREVDLIEEIARVIGMDAIPARTQARFAGASGTDRNYDRAMILRRAFVAQGLARSAEHHARSGRTARLDISRGLRRRLLRVKNPMNDEQVVLRPNLLHGLLTAVRDNLRAGAKSVRLFEVGRIFSAQRPEEFTHAAAVLAGPLCERNWRAARRTLGDLFDLKAVVSAALGDGHRFRARGKSLRSRLSLTIKANGKPVGFAGQLWPADARALDSEVPVLFVEIDLAALWKAAAADVAQKYREIPRFPATSRDIAMLAPLTLPHGRSPPRSRRRRSRCLPGWNCSMSSPIRPA